MELIWNQYGINMELVESIYMGIYSPLFFHPAYVSYSPCHFLWRIPFLDTTSAFHLRAASAAILPLPASLQQSVEAAVWSGKTWDFMGFY